MEQVGGVHYSNKAIEPIEFIERNKLPFSVGNVVKYLTRWREKGGVEDLRKAQQYVEFIRKYDICVPHVDRLKVEEYASKNKMGMQEGLVLCGLTRLTEGVQGAERAKHLDIVTILLNDLIEKNSLGKSCTHVNSQSEEVEVTPPKRAHSRGIKL